MPATFWSLTPFEAGAILDGGAKREEAEWERTAFMTAHVLNISGKSLKRSVTMDQLLGRKQTIKSVDPHTKFDELIRRMEARKADAEHSEAD